MNEFIGKIVHDVMGLCQTRMASRKHTVWTSLRSKKYFQIRDSLSVQNPLSPTKEWLQRCFKLSVSDSRRLSGGPGLQEYEPIMWFIIPEGLKQECYSTTVN